MPELKIARIETFLFDPGLAKNLLFCRVETEERHSRLGRGLRHARQGAGDRTPACRSWRNT